MRRHLPPFAACVSAVLLLAGCPRDATHRGGCLTNEQGCTLPTPCQGLEFPACGGASQLDVREIAENEQRPTSGWKALGAAGDILMTNGAVRVVISDIGRQIHLAPNGGTIIDLQTQGAQNDAINEIYTAAGLLPEDAFRYESMQIIRDLPNRVAVQVNGRLDGRPGVRVHTLYELRPCEPGVRVRSELVNESADTHMLFVEDAYFWGNHTAPAVFSPTTGAGFVHPPVRLTALNTAYRQFPYFAALLHGPTPDGSPNAVYSTVACNERTMEGFHSIAITAAGGPRSIIGPREATVFERFILAVPGNDTADGVDAALELRRQLFQEEFVTVLGRVERAGLLGDERVASVLISEGTLEMPREERTPLTQVVPDGSGNWTARVPAGKNLVTELLSFGRVVAEAASTNVDANPDLGLLSVPTSTRVTVDVRDHNGVPIYAEVVVLPADQTVADATLGDLHGAYPHDCAPYLGAEGNANPSCNRLLVTPAGARVIDVPNGRYHIYAMKGPFWSLDMQPVTLEGVGTDVSLQIRPLNLKPPNTLGADMHLHGSASHDSFMPDEERAASFAAAGINVAIATDHDVVFDYRPVMDRLGLSDEIATIVGAEATNWIPWFRVPGYAYPLTLGHTNFWPLHYQPHLPRNGAPMDEYKEPGEVYDEVVDRGLFSATNHIVQLNHPLSDAEFGRDLGFARAIFFDARRDLPPSDDGTGNGVFIRRPGGPGKHTNDDYQAQEVMNGTVNGRLLPHRAFWFYLLNQGKLRTGTANSDSHTLVDSTVGMPQTLVFDPANAARGDMRTFDVETFNAALRRGQAEGTNGPVITATLDSAPNGAPAPFGFDPIRPATPAAFLRVQVNAAPWVTVEEVRFVVNGRVVKTVSGAQLVHPTDPLATTTPLRYQADLPLTELLAGVSGDAWIVIEAGKKLMLAGDLGGGLDGKGDGLPDTTDNNGDGVVNAADVAEGQSSGPLRHPPSPPVTDPGYHYYRLTRGGFPYAFTNPFIVDVNGNGRFDAPGISGGFAQ